MLPSLHREVHQLHSHMCAGLADPTRILILYALVDGPQNVTELTQVVEAPQPTVSRHLKVLRERGLVVASRQGQSIFYTISDMRILQALDLMRAVLADSLRSQAELADTATQPLASSPDSQETP
jgi:DNA-binding transcriptional ArsR family regulator